jgi:uncharacterized protein YkwD
MPLRRHRVITHLTVAAVALAVAVGLAIPTTPIIQAGGLMTAPREGSILPANVGVGIGSTEPVVLRFPGPMDRAAVGNALGLAPQTDFSLLWNADGTTVALVPASRWAVDERYVVHVPAGTAMADGGALRADWRASFTTQTAPTILRLSVNGVVGTATADAPLAVQDVLASVTDPATGLGSTSGDMNPDTSAHTRIGLTFSAAMDHKATEQAFRITPATTGTFGWDGTTLWFTPDQRLATGTRYTLTVIGARDLDGNPLGGDTTLSFSTRAGAAVQSVYPAIGVGGVPTSAGVQITFSLPMDTAATSTALYLADNATGARVSGTVSWSADGKIVTLAPSSALAAGRGYTAGLGSGARDVDGNPVSFSWGFTTDGPVVRSGGGVPASPGSSNDIQYALNQLNAARASYGFAPLVVDSSISAVAYGHAADMAANGYFSHTSLNGMTYRQRLTAGGISYGWSGENICYLGGSSGVQATLNWCHAQFWAEPYPGGGNHKDNILNPNYRRVGIGIATGGGRVYVVWDFTD